MKIGTILFFVFAVAQATAATRDAASSFVNDVITRGQQILDLKDEEARTTQICAHLRENLGSEVISRQWLNKYFDLTRDQAAVSQFTYMVPSILVTKAVPVLGAGTGEGAVEVDATSKLREPGVYEVGVTVTTSNRTHRGTAIVTMINATKFGLIDVIYNNYSAVGYQAREYHKFLDRQYNKDPQNSMPVTALVNHVSSQSDYIECP